MKHGVPLKQKQIVLIVKYTRGLHKCICSFQRYTLCHGPSFDAINVIIICKYFQHIIDVKANVIFYRAQCEWAFKIGALVSSS